MKCEDVILELGPAEVSEAVAAHLAECPECRSTAEALGLAALPPLSGPETVGLSGLARRTERAWQAQEQRRLARSGWWRQSARLALAAGLGALVASGVSSLWTTTTPAAHRTTPSAVQTVASEDLDPEAPSVDEANLSDDEVFFEVSWPTPTEGEL